MTDLDDLKHSYADNDTLYVNDEPFFTMPGGIEAHTALNVVGVSDKERKGYVGSGTCCHGYVAQVDDVGGNGYELRRLFTPDTNAMDILPSESAQGVPSPSEFRGDILIAGTGCSGSGVRHIDMRNAKSQEIIGNDEYHAFDRSAKRGRGDILLPRLDYDADEERVYLTVNDANRRTVSRTARARKDITDTIHEHGVDIEDTMRHIDQYTRKQL